MASPKTRSDQRPADPVAEMLSKAVEAERVLVQLENLEGVELRGRTPQRSLERIDAFLTSDKILVALEGYFAAVCKDECVRENFRDAVRERLKLFERLATRDEGVEVAAPLAGDFTWAYRRLSTEVAAHILDQGRDRPGPSHYRLAALTEYSKTLAVEDETDASSAPGMETPGEETTPIAPEPDLTLLDEFTDFASGRLGSYRRMAELSRKIDALLAEPQLDILTELITEELKVRPVLEQELERADRALSAIDNVFQAEGRSALRLAAVCSMIQQFDNDPPLGFRRQNALTALQAEGALSAGQAAELIDAHEAVSECSPLTIRIASQVDQLDAFLKTAELQMLDTSLRELAPRVNDDEKLANAVVGLLGRSPSYVEHLGRLAALSKHYPAIREHVNVSERVMAVVASLVEEIESGQFKNPNSIGNHQTEIGRSLADRTRLVRSFPEAAFAAASNAVAHHCSGVEPKARRLILEMLLEGAQGPVPASAPAVDMQERCEDLVQLAPVRDALSSCRDMLLAPSGQITRSQMNGFLHNLATLRRYGVAGVDYLIQDAHTVWAAESGGDQTQNLRGFLVEAESLIRLLDLGYAIKSISMTGAASRFSFDAIGTTPSGEDCAIEIKSNLGTLSRKEQGDLSRSQIGRFLSACRQDGCLPIFVIASVRDDDVWTFAHLRSVLDRLTHQLGFEAGLKFINVQSGKEIHI